MSLKQQAVSGAKWTTVSTVATTGMQILQYIVLARLLGPEQFGLMAMLALVIGFGQLFADFGMSDAIIFRQESSEGVLSSLYWLNLLAALIVMLLVMSATPLLVWAFHEPRLYNLVWMIALGIVAEGAGKQFQVLAQKELRFRLLALVEIAATAVGLVTAVWFGVVRGDVTALIYGFLALVFSRAMLLIGGMWSLWRPRLHFAAAELDGYFDFGVWHLLDQVINFLARRVDQFVIGSVLGAQALGYYNLAWYLVVMPTSRVNPIVTRVAYPVFARLQDDVAGLRNGYLKMLRALGFVNFPLLAGIAAVAGLFVPVAFGAAWTPAIVIIQVLAAVVVIRSVGNPSGTLLMATGRVKLAFQWNLVLTLAQVPVIFFAAQWYGLVGVALSLVAVQLASMVPFYLVVIRPIIRTSMSGYFGSVAPVLAASLFMGTIVYLLQLTWLREPTPVSLALAVGAGVVVQGVFYMTVLRRQGRQIFEMLVSG